MKRTSQPHSGRHCTGPSRYGFCRSSSSLSIYAVCSPLSFLHEGSFGLSPVMACVCMHLTYPRCAVVSACNVLHNILHDIDEPRGLVPVCRPYCGHCHRKPYRIDCSISFVPATCLNPSYPMPSPLFWQRCLKS